MRFSLWKQGFLKKGVHCDLNCMVGTPQIIKGVHRTPTEGERECVGLGVLVGKWGNLPIKLMFQFIFQITCLSM